MARQYERATKISHTFRSDGSETVRVSSSDGQLVEAALDPFGALTFRMRGRPPQGEQGAESAAWILVERLNQFGATWGEPAPMDGPERGVDFVARDGANELHLQITRAFSDASVWKELAHRANVERELRIEHAVAQLWDSLHRKAVRIAPSARGSIVLGLDTSMPAVFVPTRLMIDFKKRWARETQALGFRSVWLVGPTAMLTWRVDEPFPAGEPIRIGF